MTDLVPYTPPSPAEVDATLQLAVRLSKTNFVPEAYRGKPDETLACMLTGRELGIGQMQALRDIFIQKGRPTMMTTLMVQLARRAGHRVRVVKHTDTECVIQIHRRGEINGEQPVTWTLDDAKTAGLLSKDNWRHYPKAMLWNRCAAAAIRRDCSEVLGGVIYTPEELDDGNDETDITWGEVEVDRETGEVLEDSPTGGSVTTTPDPPVATTPSIPTREQTQKLRSIQAAKELVQQADASYQLHVQAAIATLYTIDPKRFWAEAELPAWKHVLEYAVELHDHQAYETSAAGHSPPSDPPAADQTSGAGVAERTADGEAATRPVMTPAPDSPGGDTP